MRRSQKIFYWLVALWLATCVGVTVWLTPWIRAYVFPWMTAAGLFALAFGIACFLKDLWNYPRPWHVAWRVIAVAPAAGAVFLVIAWLAVRRVVICGWHYWAPHWVVLPDFKSLEGYYRNLGDFVTESGFDCPCIFAGMADSPFSWVLAAAMGLGCSAALISLAWLFYRALRQKWQPPLRPLKTMVRWLVLVLPTATLVLGLDAWGFEALRRVALAAQVVTNVGRLADLGEPVKSIDLVGRPLSFGSLATAGKSVCDLPPMKMGTCYEFNGRRFVVGPHIGSGWLCFAADEATSATVCRLIGRDKKLMKTVIPVKWKCDFPPRHVYGPWYEVGQSNIFMGRKNYLWVQGGHPFPEGFCRPY